MSPDRKPRIALVVHDIAPFGGMDRALTELIENAHDRFDFVVVSRTLSGELQPLVEWRRVRIPARPVPLKFALFFALAGLRLARETVDLVCAVGAIVPNKVDLAAVHHCHHGFYRATGRLSPVGLPLPRRMNTAASRAVSLLAERWSYGRGRTRVLTAVSQGVATELMSEFPRSVVFVIPNGVDAGRFAPSPEACARLRHELGVGKGEMVALFVGGDWGHKGLDVVLHALARARREVELRLWVVGRGDQRRYGASSRVLGIHDAVTFFGPRLDTADFFSAADVLVLPSAYEALPLVALEGLAAGLPLVATPVNGVEELFRDGSPGILVERTPQSVSDALVKLGRDPALRRRLGDAGRQIVGDYTWGRSVEATVELFERLLAEEHSRPVNRRPARVPR